MGVSAAQREVQCTHIGDSVTACALTGVPRTFAAKGIVKVIDAVWEGEGFGAGDGATINKGDVAYLLTLRIE